MAGRQVPFLFVSSVGQEQRESQVNLVHIKRKAL